MLNQIELCAAAEFQRRSELVGASFRAVAVVKGLEPPMPVLVLNVPAVDLGGVFAAWMYYPEGTPWTM